MKRGQNRSGWFAGFVVGVAAGFATLEIPILGWLLVGLYAAGALVARRLLPGVGGLLTGVGVAWIALIGRVALTCRATGSELGCQAPGIEGWLVFGFGILGGGLAITALAIVVGRRS